MSKITSEQLKEKIVEWMKNPTVQKRIFFGLNLDSKTEKKIIKGLTRKSSWKRIQKGKISRTNFLGTTHSWSRIFELQADIPVAELLDVFDHVRIEVLSDIDDLKICSLEIQMIHDDFSIRMETET